jgi:hypothetical protein
MVRSEHKNSTHSPVGRKRGGGVLSSYQPVEKERGGQEIDGQYNTIDGQAGSQVLARPA